MHDTVIGSNVHHLKFCMMTSWMCPYWLFKSCIAIRASRRSSRVSPIPIKIPDGNQSIKMRRLFIINPFKRIPSEYTAWLSTCLTCRERNPRSSRRLQRRNP